MERIAEPVANVLIAVANIHGLRVGIRDRLYFRDGGRCHICGQTVEWGDHVAEHIVPLFRGGTWDEANLALAHRVCNSRKGTKLMRELPADRSWWRFSSRELVALEEAA